MHGFKYFKAIRFNDIDALSRKQFILCINLRATVPTFNSCSKCTGSMVIIHDCMPDCHSFLGMDAWMTSQMKVALIRNVRGSLMCLAYFFLTCYQLEFHNQAPADVRSTASGIKCLYCT